MASSITCLLWRHEVSGEHFRVFCFSPLIILGEMEQKLLISYPQIFLKFLLYFMIDKLWKKNFFFFINLLWSSSFYKSLKIQIFPTWVYTISFGYLDRLSLKEEIYVNFHWDKISLSSITQQIQIQVQDVSIDELSIHWKFDFFQEILN